jgi:signal peptidase I
MTDDDDGAGRAEFGYGQSESAAFDDELGDTLAIEGSVDGREDADAGLPTAPSPPRPPRRRMHGRHRHDQNRIDAAERIESALHPQTAGHAAEPPPGTAAPKPKRKRRKAPWWELPLLVAFAITIAVLVKSYVVQPFYIPSQSMEKTLHGCPGCKGDRILVNKPIYDLRDPHPGDIVVFHAPPGWDEEPRSVPPSNPVIKAVRGFGQLIGFVPPDGLVLVKRVIATGGQAVKGDSAGHVFVSKSGLSGPWRQLEEKYVFEDGTDSHSAFGPVTVPKGRLWVMGDHRNDSADSRFHCGSGGSQGTDGADCDPMSSTVSTKEVIGKAVVIAWPPSRWRTLGTPSTFTKTAAGALPIAGGALFVLPVLLFRRRRRRRP